jgi:hypothetical protein
LVIAAARRRVSVVVYEAACSAPIRVGFSACCARRERPCDGCAAEQRDERAPFQLIELHSMPSSHAGLQDIELAMVSQGVSGRLRQLLAKPVARFA